MGNRIWFGHLSFLNLSGILSDSSRKLSKRHSGEKLKLFKFALLSKLKINFFCPSSPLEQVEKQLFLPPNSALLSEA
jgi:hypothetical protein